MVELTTRGTGETVEVPVGDLVENLDGLIRAS